MTAYYDLITITGGYTGFYSACVTSRCEQYSAAYFNKYPQFKKKRNNTVLAEQESKRGVNVSKRRCSYGLAATKLAATKLRVLRL